LHYYTFQRRETVHGKLIAVSSFGESLRRAVPSSPGGGYLTQLVLCCLRLDAIQRQYHDEFRTFPQPGINPDAPVMAFDN